MIVQRREKQIIHLDMDAFYPSVEVLDNSSLKGKPVIVGGSKERGVVSSASYEARKFGVHSAQPIAQALRLCPNGIFLPVRMARYHEVSEQIFQIFHSFTPSVEPLSVDEAFLDVTGTERLFGSPVDLAKKIKQKILQDIGLTVSAGIAPSKFVAKIASDMNKPDGLTVVHPHKVREFLDPLSIDKMWGAGKVTQKALNDLGIYTFRDLSQTPLSILERRFGKQGLKMHQLSMGIDERDVVPHHDAKSIGHELTFAQDIIDLKAAKKELLALANKIAHRMRRHNVEGKTITVKVKYSDFILNTRSITLAKATDDGSEIYTKACELLADTAVGKRPVRLLGISLSQLTASGAGEGAQINLFYETEKTKKRKDLHKALDTLYEKHGHKSVFPGTLIEDEH
ncbi:MAG: DNA polymerase IV [Deltaproteobacteria bacterium]|nr:DNA polymerase IV [Deltaproteobacteria bacterium]